MSSNGESERSIPLVSSSVSSNLRLGLMWSPENRVPRLVSVSPRFSSVIESKVLVRHPKRLVDNNYDGILVLIPLLSSIDEV